MKHWMILCAVLFGLSQTMVSAQTVVRGVVKDAASGQPIEDVSVYFKGGNGTLTKADGTFTLTTGNAKLNTINFSHVGYTTQSKGVTPGKDQTVEITLGIGGQLHDIVITARGKGHYRNKGNPAVELIRKVIAHKEANKVGSYQYLQYQEYEKMECSLTKEPEKLMNSKLFKNFKFMFENKDTTLLPGKALLPIYLEETATQRYFRKSPEKNKSYVLSHRMVNYGEYLDMRGIRNYLNRLYMPVDVYDNNIALLSTQFMSPIADLAPNFYLFYIQDTVELEGVKLVKMNFYPRNPDDLLFKGTLWITLDSNYAIQKVDFGVSKYANLNWARDVHVRQNFERGADNRYHLKYSEILAEFSLLKSSSGGVMGERAVTYSDYRINQPGPDSVYSGPTEVLANTANTDSTLTALRGHGLSPVESKIYTNVDSLQNMRSFKRTLDYATLLLAGYKRAGPWFEVGPVSAFYSFNPVEGFRLRFGGRSLPAMSKTFYTETYIAYGFKDQQVKYYLSGTYALNHRTIYDYPFHYIQASFQHDTKIPGQDLQFVQEDNFLLSFKRGDNDKWLYNDIFKLNYVREFGRGLSYNFGFKYWKQVPAGDIVYTKQVLADSVNIPSVTTGELSADLRWAPNEQFYQGKVYRIPIFNKYPIFEVKYTQGIKGLAGGQYTYSNLWGNAYKRFYLGPLGYADVTLEGGYVLGKVPFPLLDIHRANQTYAYQLNSYNLMDFMEFVSDHYGALNIDQNFGGFFFNKIPLLKGLKLREVGSLKVLYGGIRDENNPYKTAGLFKFPQYSDGDPSTYSLDGRPYIEVSGGIGNIFKVVRIDYVRRLTYLSHPYVDQWGIRVRTKFEF
ncbi:MAG TPA: DUF5686 family protein [Dinghuibacter sp.]|uniref:DUF5686 and carboxypeptidase-like regulatory domain-containing protein n=1 Tax=Dinghuibacter sp. TaxID=2024697 RepID=UPI002B648BD5|nr:DUF5686 family protein [Dinghuibacter sp.]HTJ12271.1 DUF5686 family protein [Dinghuibacter sp.]